jgi:hypothetical protein
VIGVDHSDKVTPGKKTLSRFLSKPASLGF